MKPLQAGGSNSLVSAIYSTLFKNWRARRMADFERIIQPRPGERILDVGGYHATWQNARFHGCSVDLVNIDCESESKPARVLENGLQVREIRSNGCAHPFADARFTPSASSASSPSPTSSPAAHDLSGGLSVDDEEAAFLRSELDCVICVKRFLLRPLTFRA